jgi:hypothetical protein
MVVLLIIMVNHQVVSVVEVVTYNKQVKQVFNRVVVEVLITEQVEVARQAQQELPMVQQVLQELYYQGIQVKFHRSRLWQH